MDVVSVEAFNRRPTEDEIKAACETLALACHGAALRSGWWGGNGRPDPRDNPLCFMSKAALVMTEAAEAIEADRKNKMDDHLPHLPGRTVEMADVVIRAFDTDGAFGLNLGEAVVQKLAYNAQRADHTPANREKSDGKRY